MFGGRASVWVESNQFKDSSKNVTDVFEEQSGWRGEEAGHAGPHQTLKNGEHWEPWKGEGKGENKA